MPPAQEALTVTPPGLAWPCGLPLVAALNFGVCACTEQQSIRIDSGYSRRRCMAKVEADIQVKSFGYDGDGAGRRLLFPHAETQKIEGRSGGTGYGAAECVFDGLEGRLDVLRWKADSASAGIAWLRDDGGRFDVSVQRAEFPSGVRLTRAADYGIEIISPHVTFSELKLTIKGPFGRKTTDAEPKP